MKRLLALILAMSILFSMAAVSVTAVEEQNATNDIVYVEEEAVEAAEPVAETQAPAPVELETVGETAPVVQESTHTDHAACPCAISGAVCTDHTTAADAVVWTPVSKVSDIDTSKAGNYYLTTDLVLSSSTGKQLFLNANINICLNGHSISRQAGDTHNGALIRVGDFKSAVIMNCKATIADGRLAAGSAGISGGTSTGTNAGGIHVNKGAALGVYGVNISNNTCSNTNTTGWTAGGIIVIHENNQTPPSLDVAYSRFENNKSTASGGGAIIIRGGTADIRNTVFSGNEAKTKGGAIWMTNSASTVSVTDCEFIGNKLTDSSASGGACLYTNIGSATLTRVSMTGNTNAGNNGTAITYEGTSSITLDDCTVTGNIGINSSKDKKGGIAGTSNNANLTVTGSTVIDNNIVGTNGGAAAGIECNLYLRVSGAKLTVGALESGANIHVTTGEHSVSNDPSVFMKAADTAVDIDPMRVSWIVYENRENAGNAASAIGYNTTTKKFSFAAMADHWHAACPCGISDANCVDHTSAAEELPWLPVKSASDINTSAAGNYYLTEDMVLSSQLFLKANINICLNGHSIRKNPNANFTGALIRLDNEKSVTIMNCKATITDGRLAENSAGIFDGNSSGTNAGAIHVNTGASLSVYGVNISNNTCTSTNENGWTAGAIIVIHESNKKAPALNVAYARFEGNRSPNSGGSAIIMRGGTANIRNTVFADNEAAGVVETSSAKAVGGAIFMTNLNPVVNITDSEFTGNKLTHSNSQGGAALYVYNGTANLKNVKMTGNENAGHHGTAITVVHGGLNLDDCTITNNTNTNSSNAKKGGIATTANDATVSVSGKTVIDNNIVGTKGGTVAGTECNLYLRTSGSKLTVGELESGAYIRVTTGDHTGTSDPDVFLKAGANIPEIDPTTAEWIVYENRGDAGANIVGYNTTEGFYFGFQTDHYHPACVCAIDGATCADHTQAVEDLPWQPWTSTNTLPTGEGNYFLTADVVLTKQQVISGAVAICLNGHSITQGTRTEEAGKTGALIKVDKAELILLNCKAAIEDGKLVCDENTSKISGATSDMREGACIQVGKDRSLAVYGIELCDNTGLSEDPYGWNAAAILAVADEGSVTNVEANYCRFSRNKSLSASGGAIILRGGKADFRNCVFEDNEAFTKGGAIWMMNKSPVMTMSNCIFEGNKVNSPDSSGGACIYMDNGKTTLTNVEMTGNENYGNHGTVMSCGGNSALVMDDCVITDNTNYSKSNAKKGAIATINENATVTVSGVTKIYGNMNGAGGSSPVECNVYLRLAGNKLTIGALEAGSKILVSSGDHKVDANNNALPVDDPDVFLNYTDDTPVIKASTNPMIVYENRVKAHNAYNLVGYSANDDRFYFDTIREHDHTSCVCAIEGITCDNHSDDTVYRWTAWTSADSLPTNAGYYYLTGDVVLSQQQYLNANINICMNGYSITEGKRTEAEGARNAIIRVGDKGSVTILDCQATVKNGRLSENCAAIEGFTADGTSGGAIHVNAGTTLRIYGVAFENNTNTNSHWSGWTAGAILVVSDAERKSTVDIQYARFEGNKTTVSGGNSIIIRGGTANISNTVFTKNESTGVVVETVTNIVDGEEVVVENKKAVGGAVWITNEAPEVTITDCDFIGNKFTNSDAQGGVAVYMNRGKAVLTNVTMTENINPGHHGTAISLTGSADMTLMDCVITDNTNTNAYSAKKGGVAVLDDNAKLTVAGATVIDNNMNGISGTAAMECNIFLRTSKSKLTVGQLTEGANIRVTTGDHNVDKFNVTQPVEDPDTFMVKGVEGKWDPKWDSNWVTYENNGLKVGYSDNAKTLFYFVEPTGHVHCLCGEGKGKGCDHDEFGWVAWESKDSLPAATGNYYLTSDVTLLKTANFAGTSQINICLNGHNITPAKNVTSVLLNVYDDAHLSISDCTATGSESSYKAGKITKGVDGGVRIGKTELGTDAVMNLYDGMITTNTREYYGGGIRMVGKSTFNMYGGRISSNRSKKAHGGGIGAEGGAVVNIYGGTIHGNTANQSGGGIMVKKSVVNVYGGTISKNNAYDNGGGIYAEHCSAYIYGGNICYNEAIFEKNAKGNTVGQGGGVFVRGDANNKYGIKLRITGGNFYGNKAVKGGGFLTLTFVDLTVTGGNFYKNVTSNNGGGVFMGNDTKGTISGCKIYENEAVSGGGMLTYLANIKVSNCEIYGNKTTDHGAGILIQRESEIVMENVNIHDNTAQKYGGALRMDNKAKVEMNNCTVTENNTGESGTVFASSDGTVLTLNDCSITKNKASISGGGICAMSYARIIMNSGEVKENSCLELGGGAYIRKGYMELHGGEICNNTAGVGGGGMEIEGIDIIMHRDVLLMTGGKVSGNSAPIGGGARFLSGKNTITGGTFENNTADYGGGVAGGSTGLTIMDNIVVKNNNAKVSGGGMYLDRGSRTVLTGCQIIENSAKGDGAGIWLNDDFIATNLTVTDNTSDTGVGGFYIEKADYDGHSYVSSVIKIGGKVLVTDNKGTAPGMYIAEGSLVNVDGKGLAEGTKINVNLQSGLLTRTVIGAYDYEGGNLEYVITAGGRSVTDPELLPETETPVEEEIQQQESGNDNGLLIPVLVGCGVLVLILILILLLLRKKKRGNAKS